MSVAGPPGAWKRELRSQEPGNEGDVVNKGNQHWGSGCSDKFFPNERNYLSINDFDVILRPWDKLYVLCSL